MLAAARPDHSGARCRRGVGDAVGVEYVSRVPRPPLDGLIDDLYYLEGAPPYARLTRAPGPAAVFLLNLGAPVPSPARAPGRTVLRVRRPFSASTSGRRSASAPAPTSRRPSTPTAAWSPHPPARWSSATHSGPGPSAGPSTPQS